MSSQPRFGECFFQFCESFLLPPLGIGRFRCQIFLLFLPVKQGDIATLFGPGGPSTYDLAAAAGLTTNALLSGLGPRLPRIVSSAQ